MDDLDLTLVLSRKAPDLLTAHAAESFNGNGVMFGGWTAALLVRAALAIAPPDQEALSLSMQFLRPIPPGAELVIKATCLRLGRSLSHLRLDICLGDDPAVAIAAHVIVGTRQPTERFQDAEMPATKGPEAFAPTHVAFPCFDKMETRFEHGHVWFTGSKTNSLVWARFTSPSPLDAAALAFLSDISPPRCFYVIENARPSPTIMMTVNFFATAEELAATAGDFVLCEEIGTRMEECFSGAIGRIWTRDGRLLATTEQMQWSPSAEGQVISVMAR